MFSSVVAVVALIALILPGFISARIAAGRRAGPTGIADIELVLRALGYSLVLQTLLLAIGLTSRVAKDVDSANEWQQHASTIIAYAGALIGAAVVLGILLRVAFVKLEGRVHSSALAEIVFHALGGQDARDGFDYLFQRRFERIRNRDDHEFLVIVRTEPRDQEDSGLRYGRFASESWVGLSPRPHDIYLEEMWRRESDGKLRPWEPPHSGWFSGGTIRDVLVHELPKGQREIDNFGQSATKSTSDGD